MKRKIAVISVFAFIFLIVLTTCNAQIVYNWQAIPFGSKEKTALVLNTAEYLYGNAHCKKIIQNLENNGYNVTYLADDTIDLNFTKNGLKADIIYINTHAYYLHTLNYPNCFGNYYYCHDFIMAANNNNWGILKMRTQKKPHSKSSARRWQL